MIESVTLIETWNEGIWYGGAVISFWNVFGTWQRQRFAGAIVDGLARGMMKALTRRKVISRFNGSAEGE